MRAVLAADFREVKLSKLNAEEVGFLYDVIDRSAL